MTAIQYTAAIALGLWVLIGLFFMVTDDVVRRQHRSSLEMRAWQEKVDAMRRMYDEEGQA